GNVKSWLLTGDVILVSGGEVRLVTVKSDRATLGSCWPSPSTASACTMNGPPFAETGNAMFQFVERAPGAERAAGSNVITLDPAALSAPGARSTNWNIAFPVSANGGPFIVQAEAVDGDGQHDPSVARSDFTVTSLTSPPDTRITSPVNNQLFTFPNGV